jgi:hypothetical protein
VVTLRRTHEGLNFATIGRDSDTNAAEEREPSTRRVAIALFDIDDGTLRYEDATSVPPRMLEARRVDFRASDLSFGEELRFELSAAIFSQESADLRASGTIGPLADDETSDVPIDLVIQLDEVDAARLVELIGGVDGLTSSGPVSVKTHVGGTLSSWLAHASVNASATRLRYDPHFDKPAGTPMALTVDIASDDQSGVKADNVEIALAGSKLTGRGEISTTADDSRYTIDVDAASVALADCAMVSPSLSSLRPQGTAAAQLKAEGSTASGLHAVTGRIALDGVGASPPGYPELSQISGTIAFRGRSAEIEPTTFRIDGVPAQLRGRIADIARPEVEFSLDAERFPLPSTTSPKTAGVPDALDGLRIEGRMASDPGGARLEARLRAASGVVAGIPMTALRATASQARGVFRADPIAFDAFGGRVQGALEYRAASDPGAAPQIAFKARASDIAIQQVGETIAASSSPLLGGRAAFDVDVSGAGAGWEALSRALSGSGRFEWLDGAIAGSNLPEAALEGITGVPGLSALLPARVRSDYPRLFGRKDTKFDRLAATFRMENGRVATRDLALAAQDYAIRADGTVGLDLTTDLTATLTASPKLSRSLIAEVGALRHLTDGTGAVVIPFRLTGTLPSAKPKPDLAAIGVALQKGLVGSLGEKLLRGELPTKRRAPAASE